MYIEGETVAYEEVTVGPVLPCGSETLVLPEEAIQRLSPFEHRCSFTIDGRILSPILGLGPEERFIKVDQTCTEFGWVEMFATCIACSDFCV